MWDTQKKAWTEVDKVVEQRGGICNQEEKDVTQNAVATLHTGKEGRVGESRSKTGGAKGKE